MTLTPSTGIMRLTIIQTKERRRPHEKTGLGYVPADSDAAATVKLVADGVEVTAVYDEVADKYVATVAEGTYKLTVNVPKHLSYTVNALTVAADVEKAVALYGGDFDGDGAIDAYDLGKVTTYFGETSVVE